VHGDHQSLPHPCVVGAGEGGEGVCVYFIMCGCKTLLSCIFKQTNKPELGSLKEIKKKTTPHWRGSIVDLNCQKKAFSSLKIG